MLPKTKELISCAVFAQLISSFVLAYAKKQGFLYTVVYYRGVHFLLLNFALKHRIVGMHISNNPLHCS